MTDEQKRIAIAEVMGWKLIRMEYFKVLCKEIVPPGKHQTGHCCGLHLPDEECWKGSFTPHPEVLHVVPDYLTDLNAMHEAENVLTVPQLTEFRRIIKRICGDGELATECQAIHATAVQRSEALLRTLHLHTD